MFFALFCEIGLDLNVFKLFWKLCEIKFQASYMSNDIVW